MRIKLLKSFSRFAVVLMVLCIIPSGAFAAQNNSKIAPACNITEENFTDVQTNILDSISERIAELQSFYANVSEASNASDLQKVLSSQMSSNKCMGPCGMDMGPGKKNMGHGGMQGLFCLDKVENVTDDNYTDVQTEIVSSIGNITEMLNVQLENTTDENMTEMLTEQITELEGLSTSVSEASSAAELQEVVFTYMQTQAVDSVEKEIEHLEARVSESENATDNTNENVTELNNRITELKALIEEINGAESLADLKEIMSSSQGRPGMGPDMGPCMDDRQKPMHQGGRGGFDCPCGPGRMQDGSSDNSTE